MGMSPGTNGANEKCDPFFSLNSKISGDCKCGGKWILRQNHKNGEHFYGCTKYPECANTRQILFEQEYLDFQVRSREGINIAGESILAKDKQYQKYLVEKAKRGRANNIERKNPLLRSTSEDLEEDEKLPKDMPKRI